MNCEVNQKQCEKIAGRVAPLKFRDSFLKRSFITFEAEHEQKLRAYFFSVAICHQTYRLYNKELDLFGWDYLEYVFEIFGGTKSPLIDPNFLSKLDIQQLSTLLKPHFSADRKAENCTLDRIDERAKMMIDCSKFLVQHYNGEISTLLNISDNRLYNNGYGLYETMPKMETWSDPLNKKITFFIKLCQDSNLLKIEDKKNFTPIMDYHMQRVLLRTGCVEVGEKLGEILRDKVPLKNDTIIRQKSIEAMQIIAQISGHPIVGMNDVFYMLGRSCCNEKPLCVEKKCEKSPCSLFKAVEMEEHNNCLFTNICVGEENENIRKLWQPIVETHFY